MADVIALRPKLHYGNANDVNGISDDDNDDRYDPHDAAIGEILHFPKWETREKASARGKEGRRGGGRMRGREGGAEAASGMSWHAKVLPPVLCDHPWAVRPSDRPTAFLTGNECR